MRWRHRALVVFTVREVEGVSEFVNGLFQETFVEQVLVAGSP
jgi:hypothetical protein